MARQKKGSKGPQDRNSNYQMKNGNSISRTKEKRPVAGKSAETKSAAQFGSAAKSGFMSGISSSISSATSSITKILKH